MANLTQAQAEAKYGKKPTDSFAVKAWNDAVSSGGDSVGSSSSSSSSNRTSGSSSRNTSSTNNYVSSVTIGKDSSGNTTITKTSTPSGGSNNNSTAAALNYSADELDSNGVPNWIGSSQAYDALTPEAVAAISSGQKLVYNKNNGTYLSDSDYNRIIESMGTRPTDSKDAAIYDNALNRAIANASFNSNSYYKTGDILDDTNLSQNDRMKILNSKQAYADARAVGDVEGMSRANQIVNNIRAAYGYAPSYANNDINTTLLANGGQLVEARDINGALIDGGVYTINGKAYDPKTGQAVTNGSLVYNADGTKSWVKNSLQINGTPYENYNPLTSNNALANLLGLENGSLDMQSAQTTARELGYSSLYELQQMFREQADTLKALAQTHLDNYSKDFMAAALMASEDTKSEMMMTLANEALSGGSTGAAAANLIQTIMGANNKYNEISEEYQQQIKEIEAQYNADIAAGDVNAYNKYVEQINKAKEFAQNDYYNNLMLANIAATIYASNNETRSAMNSYGGASSGTYSGTYGGTYSGTSSSPQSVIYKENSAGDIAPIVNAETNTQLDQWIEQANNYIYDHSQGLWAHAMRNGDQSLSNAQKAYIKQMALNGTITPTGIGYDDNGRQIAVLTYDDIRNAVTDFMGTGAGDVKEQTAKDLQKINNTYTKIKYSDGTYGYLADGNGLDYNASDVVIKNGIMYDKNDTKFKNPLGYVK